MTDNERMNFIDAVEDLGTDGLRDIFEEILNRVADIRDGGLTNAFAGIKVPQNLKARQQAVNSLTEALQEWAEF